MSVDDKRGPTIGLWRVIASSLSIIMASFFHHLVEEVMMYL